VRGLKNLIMFSPTEDPIGRLRKELNRSGSARVDLASAVELVVRAEMWRSQVTAFGEPFVDFGAIAVALPPHGLGVRTGAMFIPLRRSLAAAGHYRELTDTLQKVVRPRGRPKTILVGDEDFVRFWKVPTAATATDRILLKLKGSFPALFEQVCCGELTPIQAAINAGIVPPRPRKLASGVCDVQGLAGLTPSAQAKVLCEAFKAASLDAQCTLLSRVIEPKLDPELAKRWRTAG
jgi:hypothetical protein